MDSKVKVKGHIRRVGGKAIHQMPTLQNIDDPRTYEDEESEAELLESTEETIKVDKTDDEGATSKDYSKRWLYRPEEKPGKISYKAGVPQIRFERGNAKIPETTIIVNMNSGWDCPSAKKGLCKVSDICYARGTEDLYPSALPSRRAQEMVWDALTADQIADQLIAIIKNSKDKIKHIRFSECGDFKTQADVKKMSDISERLKEVNVSCYVYTARRDLDFSHVSDNLTINGSGFMVHNEFSAVLATEKLPGKIYCRGLCRTHKKKKVGKKPNGKPLYKWVKMYDKDCDLCAHRHHNLIYVLAHGQKAMSKIKKNLY